MDGGGEGREGRGIWEMVLVRLGLGFDDFEVGDGELNNGVFDWSFFFFFF